MALEIELVLLEPRDIELLTASAPLELSNDILLVVTHDPIIPASVLCRRSDYQLAGISHFVIM